MNSFYSRLFKGFTFIFLTYSNLAFASMIATTPGQTYEQWVDQQVKQASKECPLYKNLDQKGKNQIGSAYNLDVSKANGLLLPPDEKAILDKLLQRKIEAENRLKKTGEIKTRPNQSISVTDYLPKFNFFEYCNCTTGELVKSISKELFESNGTDGLRAKGIHNERCLVKEARR